MTQLEISVNIFDTNLFNKGFGVYIYIFIYFIIFSKYIIIIYYIIRTAIKSENKMSCTSCRALFAEVAQLKKEMAELKGKLNPVSPSPSVETVTSGENLARERQGTWQVQRRRSTGLHLVRQPVALETRNSFAALSSADTPDSEPGIVIVGDSMVRDQGAIFHRRSKKRAFVSCLPGAGIERVAESLPSVHSPLQATVVSVGTNDVCDSSLAELRIKFRALLSRLRERRSPCILLGVLPRLRSSREWNSRAKELNRWLHEQCVERGIEFVNLWNYFENRKYLYKPDGVHLMTKGKEYISDVLLELLTENNLYSRFLG